MGNINYKEEVSILEILNRSGLTIPDYQRPYKWERKHIRNLFYDIREAIEKDTSSYRIGSVILHNKENGQLDIVDGQQRLISISLLTLLYSEETIPEGAKNLVNCEYQGISQFHGKENYNEWSILCSLITKEESKKFYDYLMNRCHVSVIEMPNDNLPEAFQLFDSQNNRGRKLEPHDLLKAYHLRTIGNDANELTIKKWEEYNDITNDSSKLSLVKLFDKHLFRIRRWTDGDPGLTKRKNSNTRDLVFNENFIDDFKGVELNMASYPYLGLYKMLQENRLEFPSSLCMPIINGEAFFKYIEYSYDLINKLFYVSEVSKVYLKENALKFVTSKASTMAKVVNLYENMLALFIDRFGEENLTREVCEKVFVWAFYPRIVASRIFDSTQANYAAGGKFQKRPAQKLFQVINSATTPNDFISKMDMDILQNLSSEEVIEKLEGKDGTHE